jgi:hypothetical protein
MAKRSRSKQTKFVKIPLESAVSMGDGLVKVNTPAGAYNIASANALGLDKTLAEKDVDLVFPRKHLERNRGFWSSVAGYIKRRYAKDLNKVQLQGSGVTNE